jgi:hypothetical protein
MRYIKFALGIFVTLAASRFISHPPNFTNLIALSFYVPVIFGIRFIPLVIFAFAITDFFIGFHSSLFFTWGSVAIIGFMSYNLRHNIKLRITGAFLSACLFYIITNFGVWLGGSYAYTLEGLMASYTFALPFFYSTVFSTLAYSILIELVLKLCSEAGYLKKI